MCYLAINFGETYIKNMKKDLYQILGVSKSATEAEIKSAYRKLARKYHPDVNKDNKELADKFKEIGSAYDVLGDKEKRAKYDRGEIDADGKPTGYANFGGAGGGGNPFGGGFDAGGFDFSSIFGDDVFSQFTGGGGFSRSGYGRSAKRAQKGPDISCNMKVDFLSAVNGAEKKVMIMGKNINVRVPAGTVDGQTLRLKNMGQSGINGGVNGDVLINLSVEKHEYFKAEGANILLDLPISMKEAILGAKVMVPTISGNVVISIKPYSSSGDKLRLKGKGMKTKTGFGDEIITLKIMAPLEKDEKLEKVLEEIKKDNFRKF